MNKAVACLLSLFPAAALAHAGHWHLDEETLNRIFAAADAVYGWFTENAVTIATLTVIALTAWGVVWWWRERDRT